MTEQLQSLMEQARTLDIGVQYIERGPRTGTWTVRYSNVAYTDIQDEEELEEILQESIADQQESRKQMGGRRW